MGSCSSKAEITVTPVKANFELKSKKADDLSIDPNVLMDPRSPDIHRTPLTDILGNRLNYRERLEQLPQTPINTLRSRLLNYSIIEKKLLDPRSPSQFIPRTPLNLSFDDNSKLEGNTALYSIEYNGNIEDESCRNFCERLANITFDDADNDIGNDSKLPKKSLREIKEEDSAEPKKTINVEAEIVPASETDYKSSTETIHQTPNAVPAVSKFQCTDGVDDDEKNISPIISITTANKMNGNDLSAFSSTPIVANNGQLKKLLLKAHMKKANKPNIFEDVEDDGHISDSMIAANRSEDEILSTPVKRLIKDTNDNKSRTPLGVLNRRSKSFESLSARQFRVNAAKGTETDTVNESRSKLNNENVFFTPQTKSKVLRQRNGRLLSQVSIFQD